MATLIPVAEALARVLARAAPLPAEELPLAEAAGRVLAAPALALVDLPPFASSAMDGFAVRAADVPGTLPVAVRVAAGVPSPRALEPGEAMGIATGGAVPDGADTVVPVERVGDHGDSVEIPGPVEPGANVRLRGGDARAGEAVVGPGTVLAPAQLGALAAAGVATVSCARRPRAVVVTTGTELRPAGTQLGPGEIYESNGVMLGALLRSAGADVEHVASVADEEARHREALARALEADVVVSSGGVSVGPHDLVRRVLEELGVEEVFWGVSMRPGKPLAFGVRGRTLVFGLPGNPVSSLVAAELFVRPALLALQGASDPGPRFDGALLARPVRRSPERDDFPRALAEPGPGGVTTVTPLTGQESHMIVRAGVANAIVHVPAGEGELPAGSAVRYVRLS